MLKNVFAASAALAAILSLTSGSQAGAKPSDLPVDNRMQCPECQEGSVQEETVGKTETSKGTTETTLDTVAPAVAAICLEKWLQLIADCQSAQLETILSKTPYIRWFYLDSAKAQANAVKARGASETPEAQASKLFRLAEGCRRKGEYARARAFYQQVHVLVPTSRQGQLAIDRLVEIEERMRESEEAEVPLRSDSPEQSFREIRDRTIPLGMVKVTY